MNRIMRPDTVAVIGASAEDGKIGNSVMKNLINGGYQGKIYPIHPKADEIMGMTAYKSVLDVPGDVDVAVFAIPAKFVAQALEEVGKKGIPGAVLIPSGFAETGNVEGQEEIVAIARKHNIRLMGPNIYGFYYTPKPVRDVLHTVRRQGQGRAVVAVRRYWHGDHRVLALGQDGRVRDRRARQQVRHRRGRSAHVLRAGRQHRDHRPALRGPEGWPVVRRSGSSRLEEAGGGAEGGPHQPGARRKLAHGRAGRQ
jgi:predicted CoA-binding protein